MPEPESDKGKNMLDAYSDSSIRKQERTMSNVSLVSFHINTRGKQDTSMPSLGRQIRRKANFTNFTWGFVQTHTHKIHVHTYLCTENINRFNISELVPPCWQELHWIRGWMCIFENNFQLIFQSKEIPNACAMSVFMILMKIVKLKKENNVIQDYIAEGFFYLLTKYEIVTEQVSSSSNNNYSNNKLNALCISWLLIFKLINPSLYSLQQAAVGTGHIFSCCQGGWFIYCA